MPNGDQSPDATGQVGDEVSAREQADLFRLLTDHAHDLVGLHTLDGSIVYPSQSAARVYGSSPSTIFDLAHPDDAAACRAWWERLPRGETSRLRWRVASQRQFTPSALVLFFRP
jgi:PAS domain-containing protein